jgi:hypothetical protein
MASSPSRTLKLTYLGDASQLSKSTKKAGDDVSSLGDRVKNVGKTLAIGFAAVSAAGIAMGKKLFDAFEQVSVANNRIEAVITSMGNFEGQIGEVTDRLVKQAEATAKLTGVDRNLIKESQALLLTFDSVNKTAGEAGGVFDRATQAAVDLSAAGFGSVTGSATQLAKALEDPVKGLASLGRSGVTFTEEQKELIKTLVEANKTFEAQDIILKAIETQVGGVAEATATGSARIKQSFGILTEQIATALAPAFEKLVEFGLEFVDKVAKWWDENGDSIIASFGRFRDRIAEVVTNFREFVGLVVEELRERGSFSKLRESIDELRTSFGNAGQSTRAFFDALAGPGTGAKANLFVRYIESFEAPLLRLVDSLKEIVDLYDRVISAAGRLADFFKGRGPLSGGLGSPGVLPDNFVPGQILTPGTVQYNIAINGAIDPEGTARTVERVLADQVLRSGRSPSDIRALLR